MKECHDYLLRLTVSFSGNISQLPLLRDSSVFKFCTNRLNLLLLKKTEILVFRNEK